MGYKEVVLADGPAAYWRLGEPSGTSAADSASGGVNPGTLNGGITLGSPGVLVTDTDTAMTFDGASGTYIQVAYNASLDLTSALSVEAWVRPASAQDRGLIEKTIGGALNKHYSLLIGSGGAGFRFRFMNGATFCDITSGSAIPTYNVWYHVVGTWDGTTQNLYVNGVAATPVTPGLSPTTGNGVTYIGSQAPTTTNYVGRLDEIAIYPTGLSSTQVRNHYNVGLTALSPHHLVQQAVQRASYY